MKWQGGNKQRPIYWQWRRSFILEDSNWKLFKVSYPVDMSLSPNWMLSRVWSVKHFFFFFLNALSRAHRGVLVPTSLWLGPINSLRAICHCHFLASFKKKRKSMERKLLCQLFTATNCSILAWHALKLICQTTFDSILFKSLLSHAGQLSCCDITEVTWPKCGIFSCRRRRCSKRCLFSFKSILLCTSGKCQSIKQTACMLNFIYVVQSKWYLRLKISVQGPFKDSKPVLVVICFCFLSSFDRSMFLSLLENCIYTWLL